MIADPILSLENLEKAYGETHALNGVGFDVNRGEIVGFLGPNGAGKTTVMKIIMGLERADAGHVTLLGVANGASRADVRLRIGYLQEKPPIYPEMTARAYLTFFAHLYRVPQPKSRVADVLDRTDLTDDADRPLGGYSRGMQQRACIARVMLHEPEFLLLDEPTLGLDPAGVAEMRSIFREMQAAGTTLMFSSHQLSEIERVCDSLVFLSHGQVIAQGPTNDLLSLAAGHGTVTAEVAELAVGTEAKLLPHPDIAFVEAASERRLKVTLTKTVPRSRQETRIKVSQLLTDAGFTVLSVTCDGPSLEDFFLRLTKDEETKSRTAEH